MKFEEITLVNKNRYDFELPKLIIEGINYTFDERCKELRITERPWENIRLSWVDVLFIKTIIEELEGEENVQS